MEYEVEHLLPYKVQKETAEMKSNFDKRKKELTEATEELY